MFSLIDICILHFYVWKWCIWNRYHVWSIFLLFYIQYSAFSCITPHMRAWYKLCKIYPIPFVLHPAGTPGTQCLFGQSLQSDWIVWLGYMTCHKCEKCSAQISAINNHNNISSHNNKYTEIIWFLFTAAAPPTVMIIGPHLGHADRQLSYPIVTSVCIHPNANCYPNG